MLTTPRCIASLRPHLVRSRWRSASLFAIAAVAGLGAATAFGQNYYYPDVNSPLAGSADLAAIQAHLPTSATPLTLVIPAPAGTLNPDDKTLAAATADAISEELGSNISGVTVESLIRSAVQYRPKKASKIAQAAANAVINFTSLPAGQRQSYVEQITFEAASVDPKGAPAVATSVIQALVLTSASAGDADDAAYEAVRASKELAAKIVSSAIKAAKKAPGAQLTGIVTSIASASTTSAIDNGASYLVEEIAASAAAASPGVTVSSDQVFQAVLTAAQPTMHSVNDVVAITAAAMSGAGTGSGTSFKSVVSGVYGAGSAASLAANTAVEAFVAARGVDPKLDINSPGNTLATYIANHPTESAAAATAGAVNAWFRSAPNTIALGVHAVKTHPGNSSSFTDVITAGVRAYPAASAKVATAVVNQAEADSLNEGDSVGAVIAGSRPEYVGAVTLAGVKALNSFTPGNVSSIVTKAVQSAQAAGFQNTIGSIAYSAIKGSKLSTDVVTAAVQAVDISTDPTRVAAAAAGAIVADKKNADAIQLAATGARGDDNNTLIDAAANVAKGILLTPKNFYNLTTAALGSAGGDSNTVLAVVYGATQANPKGANAIAAAAVANSSVNRDAVINAAQGASFKLTRNITFAVDTALHVKADASDLVGYVANQVFVNPSYTVDIVTGATVAKPEAAHFIAHAVGFRAPTAAGKAVPALFGFSHLDTNVNDKPAAAAAIMAGLADGILEAKLVSTKEVAALKAAVSAAVKAALFLTGPDIATSTGTQPSVGPAGVVTGYIADVAKPGETDIDTLTVGAVLTAAVKSAKAHALAIAQAAAEAAAWVSGNASAYVGNNIVAAIMAAGVPVSQSAVQAAVDFGKQQAVLGNPGAGAKGVVNYQHHSGTGPFVTSIFNL